MYDVTDFIESHPGGEGIIIANAGKDATYVLPSSISGKRQSLILRKIFKPLHPPDALDMLEPSQHLGPVDPLTMPEPEDTGPTDEEKRIEEARKRLPPADSMLLLDDFERWAEEVLSGTAWNYYKSAGKPSSRPVLPC